MREPDQRQLPLVETFGEQLDRAIANRARSPRRSPLRALGAACAAGMVALSLLTPPGRAASGAVGEWLGLGDTGGPPTIEGPRSRGNPPEEPISSIVVATGRAPDGVRYEFVLERFAEPAKSDPPAEDVLRCLNVEWPDTRVGPIRPLFGCHPSFPPAGAEKAVVKWVGAMFDPALTTYVHIAGFARADVSDVRLLYRNERGAKRDAAVNFAQVTTPLPERAGAYEPFGIFIAFLPQAWLGYGANFDPRPCPVEEQSYEPDAIEVIAYDHQGKAIARETGNNLISTDGRPHCP